MTLDNATGLHVRPATTFMAVASRYRSTIHVVKDDRVANGKSAISLMQLEAGRGTEIAIQAAGDDEVEAVDALVGLIERAFTDRDNT